MKKSALLVVLSLALLSPFAQASVGGANPRPEAQADSVGGANPRPEAVPSDWQIFAVMFLQMF